MWYIVYKEEFKTSWCVSGGYFVKYQNKMQDKYSPNWFEANKYVALGAALSRLGIEITPNMDTMEKFCKGNKIDYTAMNRDSVLSDILGEEKSIKGIEFKKGRIEKISSDGQFIGSAGDEVLEFIKEKISKNKVANDKKMKNYNDLIKGVGDTQGYIVETKEGEDFWEGF